MPALPDHPPGWGCTIHTNKLKSFESGCCQIKLVGMF